MRGIHPNCARRGLSGSARNYRSGYARRGLSPELHAARTIGQCAELSFGIRVARAVGLCAGLSFGVRAAHPVEQHAPLPADQHSQHSPELSAARATEPHAAHPTEQPAFNLDEIAGIRAKTCCVRRPPYSWWLKAMSEADYRSVPFCDPQFRRFVIRGLRQRRDRKLRYLCAHHARSCEESEALESALIDCAADPAEHPVLRGQCLERINFQPSGHRRLRRVRRLLLQCLRDPDANVRFWACFGAPAWALPLLRGMTDDPGVADMGWTVGYEAGEAIKSILGQPAWADDGPVRLPHPYECLWQ